MNDPELLWKSVLVQRGLTSAGGNGVLRQEWPARYPRP